MPMVPGTRKAAPKAPRKTTRKATRKTMAKTAPPTKRARQANAPRGGRRASPGRARKAAKPTKVAKVAKPSASRPAKPAARPAARGTASVKPLLRFKEHAAPKAMAEARPLRIAVFGASGNIGRRITQEALARGHRVTAVMRHPDRFKLTHPNLRAVKADVTDPLMAATVARGHDAIVSAIAPTTEDPDALSQAAAAILQAAREAGIKRIVISNGAGSLLVGKGKMLMDTPDFPSDWRWVAKSHYDALRLLRERGADLDWTAVSPAAEISPGKRTGKFRLGGDDLMSDPKGASRISMEDYAAALMDELEKERFVGKRMSVAY